jgi:polyisoprenoid-binding protein YceI
MRLAALCLVASAMLPSPSRAQAPVFVVAQNESSVRFSVQASVALEGNFEKWDASLTFKSPNLATGVLDIKIQAASVNTGSGMKDGKLKSADFFNVKKDPLITFLSKKIVKTGPDTFDVQGDFTIRGVSKPVTLALKIYTEGAGSGDIKGTMFFDRRDYGMDSGIPFIRIADRVEVTVNLKARRVSGPPVVLQR